MFVEEHQEQTDFWKSRHYYFCSEYAAYVGIQDEVPEPGQFGTRSGFSLDYTDENTLIWDDDHIYVYSE